MRNKFDCGLNALRGRRRSAAGRAMKVTVFSTASSGYLAELQIGTINQPEHGQLKYKR
jgi:hypothetical protein